jgi:hypothetical protein
MLVTDGCVRVRGASELYSLPQNSSSHREAQKAHTASVKFLCFCFFVALFVCFGCVAAKADGRSRVRISITKPGEIKVEAELCTAVNSWSFRNAYAGVLGIAERVSDFQAQGAVVKKIVTGEFRSDLKSSKISYTVKLLAPTAADVSHVSWLVGDRGFLMFADLVPLEIHSPSAEFTLPDGWTVEAPFPRDANGHYDVAEPEKAVFFVGRSLSKTSGTVEGMDLEVVLSGKWPFKERDALDPAISVMQKYVALTGFRFPGKALIVIAPLPVSDIKTGWKAETRGSTVVLLINPNARFEHPREKLTIIFTHEVLHLWVPNSLHLEGDYDWFYEGFTLYTALRTALELKAIDFKEFLNTLGRVYDSYCSNPDTLSLIDESERRWGSSGSQVYVKGMLVAFLYDLMIRKESGGQKMLADRYRDLFSGHVADGANGNEVIISVLSSPPGASHFTKSYVESSAQLELERILPAYGLSLESTGKGSQLRVGRELNEEQKRLLQSLGYRN